MMLDKCGGKVIIEEKKFFFNTKPLNLLQKHFLFSLQEACISAVYTVYILYILQLGATLKINFGCFSGKFQCSRIFPDRNPTTILITSGV